MMLWSDSTCLAAFGHASAWPMYLSFKNLLKYARSRPEGGACHPIAFIPCVHKFSTDVCPIPEISLALSFPGLSISSYQIYQAQKTL